ncbi:hypothetical protein MCERE155_00043 [Candidatus Nanopelagicaceae bacterium]
MKTFGQCISRLKYFLSCDLPSVKYKLHLRRHNTKTNFGQRIILVESDQSSGNVLGLSLFLPALTKHLTSKVNYFSMIENDKRKAIKQHLRNYFSVNKSIGLNKTFIVQAKHPRLNEFSLKMNEITTAEELEEFSIDGVRIGDLVYDTFLRRTSRPTVEIDSKEFQTIFSECVSYFLNLQDLFRRKEISAVCISHCVYHFAIPARLALSFGIPVFQVTSESIYRLNRDKTHAYTEFTHYRETFSHLSETERTKARNLAKVRLDQRFSGQVAVDMPYSTKSAFSDEGVTKEFKFPDDGKKRILIATHDFFDSPHSYGDNLYPDFYIWLERLGELSNETDYNWYLKTHRDSVADDKPIFAELIRKFPKFNEIDANISHHKIIQAGIDLVLTVFGTVGMEYPALGIPVINASRNNPHVNYDFSVTPKNITEYESLIRNLSSYSFQINKSEIYEFYYMAHLFNPKSWIYYDYDLFLEDIGGYEKSVSNQVFTEFLRNSPNRRPLFEINSALDKFLVSGDFRLARQHFE